MADDRIRLIRHRVDQAIDLHHEAQSCEYFNVADIQFLLGAVDRLTRERDDIKAELKEARELYEANHG